MNDREQGRELRRRALEALRTPDPDAKLSRVRELARGRGALTVDPKLRLSMDGVPGRPERPELVPPQSVPRRGFGTREGRAATMHAIAHIEFNAINLALDAVCRFAGMPEEYYRDWARVAAEEAYHFELVRAHLRHLGFDYGDFAAHNGLWEMAEKTAGDVLERMALVPRVLEARGLDVTPRIQAKLRAAGDAHAARILDIIHQDEVGHVALGGRWFAWLCRRRGLDVAETFRRLLARHFPNGLSGPFGLDIRRRAGFSEAELRVLTAMDAPD